jgi:AraC-like DNA-binding protein/ubiquinone/menaquinone biosynthesis C-methylase UbiE
MSWFEDTQKAINYIETNLFNDISAEDIANHIHYSSNHFQKMFLLVTDFTVSEYIRNRRLSLAGQELAATGNKMIDIALKYGYETPESFAKAFTRFHGFTPSKIKRAENQIIYFSPLTIQINITGGFNMSKKIMDLNMRTEDERKWAVQAYNKKENYYENDKPDYPQELITTIINKADLNTGSKVLEIGAGSGRATKLFADFGFEMLCIEPGAGLAEMGNERFKDKNIKFIVSPFEDYAEPFEYFDAVIAAQAFHWVSQPIGYEKCAKTLKKGGWLVPFWNLNLYSENIDIDRELWAILCKYEGWVSCMQEKDYPARMESITSKIVGSGLFSKPEIIHFYKEYNFTADGYFNFMGGLNDTYMNGLSRTDAVKQACQEELTQLAEKYDGIKRNFHYELYLTQKL